MTFIQRISSRKLLISWRTKPAKMKKLEASYKGHILWLWLKTLFLTMRQSKLCSWWNSVNSEHNRPMILKWKFKYYKYAVYVDKSKLSYGVTSLVKKHLRTVIQQKKLLAGFASMHQFSIQTLNHQVLLKSPVLHLWNWSF